MEAGWEMERQTEGLSKRKKREGRQMQCPIK
jgi:hypothetical protein